MGYKLKFEIVIKDELTFLVFEINKIESINTIKRLRMLIINLNHKIF